MGGINILKNKVFIYVLIVAAGALVYYFALARLAALSLNNQLYSHMPLIPIVSLYFLITERKKIFSDGKPTAGSGALLALAGLVPYGLGILNRGSLQENDFLALCIAGFVLWLIGGFVGVFGREAFRRGIFPMLFMAFMIPIPTFILDPLVEFLQVCSAHAVEPIFKLIGLPYFRDGLVYEVPGGVAVKVASECSGIRSTIALVITAVVAGHMFLRSNWRRVLLVLCVFPVTIFKNALRITSLTTLAAEFDKSWLDSWLHRSGGVVYLMIAFAILGPVLWFLRWTERKKRDAL
ncbi:MAG: exosortase [Desulfobacteraceae bacterium]|nr:MAG: exosortase [Desulfobacteraceae bacterium]